MKWLLFILFIGLSFPAHAQDPLHIPQPPTKHPLPAHFGGPATPNPVYTSPIPQNPFLAANGTSNCHNDTYMSDLYFTGGPLGESPTVLSRLLTTPPGSPDRPGAVREALVIYGEMPPPGRYMGVQTWEFSAHGTWKPKDYNEWANTPDLPIPIQYLFDTVPPDDPKSQRVISLSALGDVASTLTSPG